MQTNLPPTVLGLPPSRNDNNEVNKSSYLLQAEVEGAVDSDGLDFLIKFGDNDPDNPRNFSSICKAWLVFQMSLLTMAAAMAAALMAPTSHELARYLHISRKTTSLVVALFVLGWAFGPMLWAPISEIRGRRWGILPAIFLFSVFSIGTAVGTNTVSILATRFLTGVFASAAISNGPASLGDIYAPETRGIANAIMALWIAAGLCIAPVVGSAISVNQQLGWRWTQYIQAITVASLFLLSLISLPETYAPMLLKRKVDKLRRETRDLRYWHSHEKFDKVSAFTKYFGRPLRLMFTEPIVACIALYASFTYSLLYLIVQVFPIVFRDERRWNPVSSNLPFLGVLVGVLFAVLINISDVPRYRKAVQKNNGEAVPEARLLPMLAGGMFLTTGLFGFGWTAAPQHHWILPVIAAGFIGAGFNLIYIQSTNVLVDIYGIHAACPLSATTTLRSVLACGLSVAAHPMIDNLGIAVSCSVLGGISCLALPMPLLFRKYRLLTRKRRETMAE